MGVKYIPAKPMPAGYRHYHDVVREIEATEGLEATGWHYAEEPTAEEVAYKSRVHHGGAALIVREAVYGVPGEEQHTWQLFTKGS